MEEGQKRVRGIIKKSMYMYMCMYNVHVQCTCTVDHEFFVVKNFLSTTFSNENLNTQNILCNVCRLCEKFTSKIFTSENIPIYGVRSNLADSGL